MKVVEEVAMTLNMVVVIMLMLNILEIMMMEVGVMMT